MMTRLNLDQKSAQYAQEIVKAGTSAKEPKAVENLITKTLGILQEQGVYAMMLFLFSRSSDENSIAEKIRPPLYKLLSELPTFSQNEQLKALQNGQTKAAPTLDFYSNQVCESLDTLLLVRDLYEQTLIYARYGAKAEGK
ncbi:MAG TPA: hypothetical protein VGD99_28230 [Anaerolineae bacterium]|jgi:hypothetical protein